MFSAILLPAGSHDIELRYQTPGLRMGAAISAGTLLLMLVFAVVYTIISEILRARDRRVQAVPVGTYEAASTFETVSAAEAGQKDEETDPGPKAEQESAESDPEQENG